MAAFRDVTASAATHALCCAELSHDGTALRRKRIQSLTSFDVVVGVAETESWTNSQDHELRGPARVPGWVLWRV